MSRITVIIEKSSGFIISNEQRKNVLNSYFKLEQENTSWLYSVKYRNASQEGYFTKKQQQPLHLGKGFFFQILSNTVDDIFNCIYTLLCILQESDKQNWFLSHAMSTDSRAAHVTRHLFGALTFMIFIQ